MGITTPTSYQFIEFNFSNLSGAELVGGYVLRWSLQFDIANYSSDRLPAEFSNASLEISLEAEGNLRKLGSAIPEHPVWITSKPHNSKHYMMFDLTLSTRAIESLERLRAGSEPKFHLKLIGEVIEGEQRHTRSESITTTVSQESWIHALEQMNFRSALVYETPFTLSPDANVRAARSAIDRANNFLYRGEYDEVIAKCRIAIEALESYLPEKPTGAPKTWTKDERLLGIINQLKNYTHLAHHLDGNDIQTHFSRKEAIFVMTSTIGAIACFTENAKSDIPLV